MTLVDWRNPHVHVFMNVRGQRSRSVNWAIELEEPDRSASAAAGRARRCSPGDAIRVEGIAARNGSHQAWGNSVVDDGDRQERVNVTLTPPAPPLEPRPTPRWPDRQPRLGAGAGRRAGYWAYPERHGARRRTAPTDAPMDTWGLLKNIADAPKVAPMQPWALRSTSSASAGSCRTTRCT